jgi:indole-3-glycerol phosphate synthase
MTPARPDLLATIVAATRRTVEARLAERPLSALQRAARECTPRGAAFLEALARPDRLNIIAECKRRSPSRGVLRAEYDPVTIARSYEAAGAAALSILTEPTFFDGSLDHLSAVREATVLPVLRKDFIVDAAQLLEARVAGADAVLLIVAALSESELGFLMREAEALGLTTLVEVHDLAELEIAVAAGARLIGVNNRNLRTLDVSLQASEQLIARMPAHCLAVAESGLRRHDDLVRLAALGYRAFLVGERLMTSPDPGAALHGLLAGEARHAGARSPS